MSRAVAATFLGAALLVARPALADDLPPPEEQSYAVRLADLERRVEELKARIRNARPRSVPPFAVTLTSRTSATFVLERATVTVDDVENDLTRTAFQLYDAPGRRATKDVVTQP